ncbi:histidine phosphatase family protein [Clostridium sp.]|jgi:probable phosphoglycerate mutase|uniref:histidine phosphatase family protein n=1 Tax=Clostridium sp. TaxID=1506 RepID=UPI00258AFB75|nr:histidine phosphatase family protein [Clostridium sp.]MDF2504692.1 pspA [Clostridium sp.]
MSTSILLIRHGETEWNALGKFQGSKDIELSNAGILQATFLKKKTQDNFDSIYCSPLKRAFKTAQILCDDTNLKPVIVKQLREIDFGEWEGLTLKEIKANYPEKFRTWTTDAMNAPLCGGDHTLRLASIRAKDAVLKIAKENNNKKVLVVAHGGIIKAALIGIFNWDMTMYHKMSLGNTSICKLSFNDDLKPLIVTLNDTNHLPEDYHIKSFV